MEYNDKPAPDNLRLLANDPTFPNPGFWHDRLHAAADAWEAMDLAFGVERNELDNANAALHQRIAFLENCNMKAAAMRGEDLETIDTLRQRLEEAEANFQSQRRLSCSCYVGTQEQLAEWNRLQGLP